MHSEGLQATPGSGKRPISWQALAVWWPGSLLVGLLLGGAAAVAQAWFAPVVFFPLLVGFLLGLMLVGLLRTAQMALRSAAFVGTLVAVCGLVVVEHYVCYRMALRAAVTNEQLRLARQAFPEQAARMDQSTTPDCFAAYMYQTANSGRPLFRQVVARGGWAWASWAVDGLLLLGAALTVVVPALRLPYCGQCRSWYRTTRSGRLRTPLVRRLATVLGTEVSDLPPAARYRVLTCNSGCGPMGLELSWRNARHDRESELAWLDESQRLAVLQVLDENRQEEPGDHPAPH